MDVAEFLKSTGVKMDTDQSPAAAAEAFIAEAKYRGLQPAEAVQLVDHDARPVILNFFQEQLSGGFPDE